MYVFYCVYFRSQFGPKFGTEVECISRIKFLETDIVYFSRVRSIVMDEVHHFRIDDESKNWYEKADKIVSGKCREGQWSNGYLWLFMDMFQKENKFKSG